VVLGTGFCGAYTTFSTCSFETIRLLEEGSSHRSHPQRPRHLATGAAAAALGFALAAM
jgi:CrcB protein